jgi:hypothetical protein
MLFPKDIQHLLLVLPGFVDVSTEMAGSQPGETEGEVREKKGGCLSATPFVLHSDFSNRFRVLRLFVSAAV